MIVCFFGIWRSKLVELVPLRWYLGYMLRVRIIIKLCEIILDFCGKSFMSMAHKIGILRFHSSAVSMVSVPNLWNIHSGQVQRCPRKEVALVVSSMTSKQNFWRKSWKLLHRRTRCCVFRRDRIRLSFTLVNFPINREKKLRA